MGIHIDSKLSWCVHFEAVCSRAQKRLCFLWRLGALGVSTNLLLLFYRATTESLIRYGITSFYGNQSVQSKSQFLHITSTSSKIVGSTLSPSLQEIFEQTLFRQAQKICSDATHALHSGYQLLPSGKRYRIPKRKLNHYKYSFISLSIKELNKHIAGKVNILP